MNARIKKKIDKRLGYKSYGRARFHTIMDLIKYNLCDERLGYTTFKITPYATWSRKNKYQYKERNINLRIDLFEYPFLEDRPFLYMELNVKGLQLKAINQRDRTLWRVISKNS